MSSRRRTEPRDPQTVLSSFRSHRWLWRMARRSNERRALAMKLRWRLRWLEGHDCYAAAKQALDAELGLMKPCERMRTISAKAH
jgi:hypothetical protein